MRAARAARAAAIDAIGAADPAAALLRETSPFAFGPSAWSAGPLPPPRAFSARDEDACRLRVLEAAPDRPGVYGMADGRGHLIYVGKSKQLRSRLMSYFRSRGREDKQRRIMDRTATLGFEPQPSEFAALLRELELIQRHRPRYNVKGQPGGRRHAYVCLGGEPAAKATLERHPPKGCEAWFGPVPGGGRSLDAVRRLNDWFGLADCPRRVEFRFADQPPLFPMGDTPGCLRHELGLCLGPCVGACDRAAYRRKVRQARDFLAGKDDRPVAALEREMNAAAAAMEFERAAGLRDLRLDLLWLLEHLGRLRMVKGSYHFVYPVASRGDGPDLWYLMRGGLVAGVLRPPANREEAAQAAATIRRTFATLPTEAEPSAVRELDILLLVMSWFRAFPEERTAAWTAAEALAKLEA